MVLESRLNQGGLTMFLKTVQDDPKIVNQLRVFFNWLLVLLLVLTAYHAYNWIFN